jgi:hypothetical protein
VVEATTAEAGCRSECILIKYESERDSRNIAKNSRGMSDLGQVTRVTPATDPIMGVPTYTPGTPTIGMWLVWSQLNDINGRVAREWAGKNSHAFVSRL